MVCLECSYWYDQYLVFNFIICHHIWVERECDQYGSSTIGDFVFWIFYHFFECCVYPCNRWFADGLFAFGLRQQGFGLDIDVISRPYKNVCLQRRQCAYLFHSCLWIYLAFVLICPYPAAFLFAQECILAFVFGEFLLLYHIYLLILDPPVSIFSSIFSTQSFSDFPLIIFLIS